MSWWVYLRNDDGSTCQVQNHSEGGTHAVGGTNDAELNITYNYGEFFCLVPLEMKEGRGSLHGKRAADTIPLLAKAVKMLGTDTYDADYWAPTPGNAGHALNILLEWARQYPEAHWEVS